MVSRGPAIVNLTGTNGGTKALALPWGYSKLSRGVHLHCARDILTRAGVPMSAAVNSLGSVESRKVN